VTWQRNHRLAIERLELLIMAVSNANNSPQSAEIELYSGLLMQSVRIRSSSQYAVSPHAFRAIDILDRKSGLLCADSASLTFAPIDVPERSTCLASTCSLWLRSKCLWRLTIRTAKSMLFSPTAFSFMRTFSILHFPFYIRACRAATTSRSARLHLNVELRM